MELNLNKMNKGAQHSKIIVALAISFLSAIIIWNCTFNNGNAEIKYGEWVQLFNGKDFDDWDLMLRDEPWFSDDLSKVFTIDGDSSIHFFRDIPDGFGVKTRKNATHGIKPTKRNYSKYHLKFEYKWGTKLVNDFEAFQYDAGVYYHLTKIMVFPVGMQYQVRYDHLNKINFSGEIRAHDKLQWYSADGKSFSLPSKGGILQPTSNENWGVFEVAKDVQVHGLDNEWNQCEIIVMGNEYIIHKLNGEVVNMAINLSVGEGPIAIEAETGEIFWRNMVIKEFEESVPIEKFLN